MPASCTSFKQGVEVEELATQGIWHYGHGVVRQGQQQHMLRGTIQAKWISSGRAKSYRAQKAPTIYRIPSGQSSGLKKGGRKDKPDTHRRPFKIGPRPFGGELLEVRHPITKRAIRKAGRDFPQEHKKNGSSRYSEVKSRTHLLSNNEIQLLPRTIVNRTIYC